MSFQQESTFLTIAELKKLSSVNTRAIALFEKEKWTIHIYIGDNYFRIRDAKVNKERVYTTINAATNALFKCGIYKFDVLHSSVK